MKTRLRKATDPEFDADTLVVTLDNGATLRIYAYPDRVTGAPVIQIDTDSVTPVGWLHVMVDDGQVWAEELN